jgi:hypothetical protein
MNILNTNILKISSRRVRALAVRRKVGTKIPNGWLFTQADIEKLRPGKPGRPIKPANK